MGWGDGGWWVLPHLKYNISYINNAFVLGFERMWVVCALKGMSVFLCVCGCVCECVCAGCYGVLVLLWSRSQ